MGLGARDDVMKWAEVIDNEIFPVETFSDGSAYRK